MPTGDVLDPAVVAGLRRAQEAFGTAGFIRQLVALFQANAPGRMERIRLGLAARDAAEVREAAHALTSSCALLGATAMADACARVEAAAARSDLPAAADAFADAEALLPPVRSALSALSTLE